MSTHVLIIDPDQIERRYMAAVLAADGFDLVQVPSAIEGMVQAMETDPALVIIAEETDPVRVHEAVALLRRLTPAPLMVVGNGEGGEEMASLKGGGDFYLTRPFSAPELVGRARMLIRRAGGDPEKRESVTEERSNGESGRLPGPGARTLEWHRGSAGGVA